MEAKYCTYCNCDISLTDKEHWEAIVHKSNGKVYYKCRQRSKQWQQKDRISNPAKYQQRWQQWYINNKNERAEYWKTYYAQNRSIIIRNAWQRDKQRLQNDVQFKIARSLRVRMAQSITRIKTGSSVRDLGIDLQTFRVYIESQWEPGMSWENYGEWHLDHVIPLAHFNLEDPTEFKEAANWLNLRPMWAKDNIRKGTSIG